MEMPTFLAICLGTILGISGLLFLMKQNRLFRFASLLLAISIIFFASYSPAFASTKIAASAAFDKAVPKDETDLKMTPSGKHYSGLEYVQRTKPGESPVSDSVIEKSIKSEADESVVVGVANGSVRLSGTIDDQKDARDLISKIKEIPGVHEITFDLGLEE